MPVELIHDGNASFNGDFLINGVRALTAEPTIESVVSAAIVTPDSAMSIIAISAQAEALFIANPTGTWSNGQSLLIRIEDDGSAQSIAFEDKYVPSGVSLPTTTIVGQILYLQIYYNSDTLNFDVVFVNVPPSQDSLSLSTLSSPVSITNTNAETIYPTTLGVLPTRNFVGSIYTLHLAILKSPSGHSSTIRIYINTSNNLSGSPVKVLEYGSGFNSNTLFPFMFRYFLNDVGLIVPRDVNAAQGVLSNFQVSTLINTTPIVFSPSNTYFFIITTQMNVTNSTETLQFAKLCQER